MKHYHRAWRSPLVSFGTYSCCGGSVAKGPEQQSLGVTISVGRRGAFCLHRDGRFAIADRTCAVVFNPGDVYRTSHPDRCDDDGMWFTFRRDAALDVLAQHDARVAHEPERPFRDLTVPMTPRAMLLAAALLRDVQRPPSAAPQVRTDGRPAESLPWDERALEWLDALASAAPVPRAAQPPRAAPSRAHRDLADEARRLLALRFAEPLRLQDLAASLAVSPFHLCRVFRSVTGSTLHAALERHRLAAALDAVRDPQRDLSRIALDCGFSSHSHLTARFHRAFGLTPSGFRGARC